MKCLVVPVEFVESLISEYEDALKIYSEESLVSYFEGKLSILNHLATGYVVIDYDDPM